MIVSGFIYPTYKSPSDGYLFNSNTQPRAAQLELRMEPGQGGLPGRVQLKVLDIDGPGYVLAGHRFPMVGEELSISADTLRQYLMSNSWERWFPVFGDPPNTTPAKRRRVSPAEIRQYGLLLKSGPLSSTDHRAEEQRVLVWLDSQAERGLGGTMAAWVPEGWTPDLIEREPRLYTMTYGVMPSFETFEAAFMASERAEGGYTYTLRGSDAEIAYEAGIPVHTEAGAEELYEIIGKLRAAWENGNEGAGDLASAFLSTLGFEWV